MDGTSRLFHRVEWVHRMETGRMNTAGPVSSFVIIGQYVKENAAKLQ
ncbi:MAG: hypothetical protein UZ16_OP3001000411 [Candidatus Hinthialibacteria bacterium OLB16]|nr:MAG: hypothetical protein UZ16_OP3001000411 [Candidatus Hinthialibacteria bacterium OLB16]